jgi:hypothetical protein
MPAVNGFSELRLKPWVNVFGRDTLFAEEPDGHSPVVLHRLSEQTEWQQPIANNPKRRANMTQLRYSLSPREIETL